MPGRPAANLEILRRSLTVTRQDIEALRKAGHSETEIARIVADAAARAARLTREAGRDANQGKGADA